MQPLFTVTRKPRENIRVQSKLPRTLGRFKNVARNTKRTCPGCKVFVEFSQGCLFQLRNSFMTSPCISYHCKIVGKQIESVGWLVCREGMRVNTHGTCLQKCWLTVLNRISVVNENMLWSQPIVDDKSPKTKASNRRVVQSWKMPSCSSESSYVAACCLQRHNGQDNQSKKCIGKKL